MTTLLLHKNRLLRAFALFSIVALVIGTSSSLPTAAAGAVTSVRLRINPRCGDGSTFDLKAGATTILSGANGNLGCSCTGLGGLDVSTNVAAALALVGAPGCTDFTLTSVSQSRTTWARLDITRTDGTEAICFVDNSGNNSCATATYGSCNYLTHAAGTVWAVGPGDTDADGANNCVDPDIDGDGVANGVDNCSYANPNQMDANNDSIGDMCQPAVVAVPWLGSELLPHQVISGTSIVLQAAAYHPGTGDAIALASGTWDPGDGSGQQPIANISNSRNLEFVKTYTGSAGQPFTATVRVVDTANKVYTDTFKVVIAPDTRETKVNMAIDKGLWNLHKRQVLNTSDGRPSGNWVNIGSANIQAVERIAATASSVQAFEINNHRESGDALRDPYVRDVQKGLRYLLSLQNGALKQVAIGMQGANNPDSNGNGIGLMVSGAAGNPHAAYLTGQVLDAFVASGTPNKRAETGQVGSVRGRTYKDIVADMLDGYSWGMHDATGGWWYNFNETGNDTSASHWWGIGVLAGQVWGLDAPAWVKNLNWTVGVPLMQLAPPQAAGCYFGYTNNGFQAAPGSLWGDSQTNVTAAGLILINADGISKNNARFKCAEQWLDGNFNTAGSFGNFYTMYQTAKAMRTAVDDTGATSPITLLNGTRDWYAAYADYLISIQDANGAFPSTQGSIGSYIKDDMATSWGVIILSPSLFELPPSAACSASPATIGTNGGNVNFSAAASFHPDATATITGYSWNFGDSTAAGSGVTTSHNYAAPATFPTTRNATVTVTDSNGNSSTASCPVTIVNTNVPPAALINGPYTVCQGSPITLVASATDEDGTITSTDWDLTAPFTPFTADASGTSVNATAFFAAKAPGTYDIAFRAIDNSPADPSKPNFSIDFDTVTVLAPNNAACNQPPVANDDTASTLSGVPVAISVLTNDTDPNNDTLSISSATAGANGSTVVNGNGTVTYSPNNGFAGTDTFSYTVSDGKGGTDTATVTVTVTKKTVTATATGGTFIYNGGPFPGSCSFVASDGAPITGTLSYGGDPVPLSVGTTTITCSFNGTGTNYSSASASATIIVNPAPSVTVVNCPVSVGYSGGALTVCSASVTGAGGLNQPVTPVTYVNNVNVGTATATANYAGGPNHTASSDDATFDITPAATVTVVNCPVSVTYSGGPMTVCSAQVTGPGLNQPVTPVSYTNNVNVGTATATANYAGGGNYSGSSDDATFLIKTAPLHVMAKSQTKIYGTVFTFTGTEFTIGVGGPLLGGDTVTSVTLTSPGTPAPAPVGGYFTTPSAAVGTGLSNYTISYIFAPFQVLSATPTVTATGGTFVYDGLQHAGVCTATGAFGEPLLVNTTYIPGGATAPTNVGSYVVRCETPPQPNYLISTKFASITITKAPSVTTVTCDDVQYDGTPKQTCTANVTGAGGLNQSLTVSYVNNVNVGTAKGSASYAGDANHSGSNSSDTFAITQAPTTTVVTCADAVYTGAALTTCTANVTGAGGLNQSLTVSYVNNVNVGTAKGSANYAGDLNHTPSNGSDTFEITPAPSVTVVSCTASVVYNGSAQEVCSASVTGVGGLTAAVTPVTYTNNTNAGTAGAAATYTGDANHTGSSDTETFEITKAPTVTVVSCPASQVYTGSAITPCTANVTGVAGLNHAVTPVTYTANTNVGTAGASATFAETANYSSSTGSANFQITQAPTATSINAPTITVAANGTVTVSVASGSGTVLGTVSLTVDGGAAVTQALSGGSSVFTVNAPNAGDHALVASYAAQGNFSASGATGNLHVNPSPTATVLTTSATPQLAGTPVTFTATVTATAPGSGTPTGEVTFLEGATVLGTGTLNGAGVATFTTTTLSNGPHTITASYTGVNNYLPSNANTVSKLIFGLASGGGTFVISDTNAIMGKAVNFWGAQWEKNNIPTGGVSNASFKGYAISPAIPTVGATFTSAPGNSAPPPAGVPQYMGIIVTSKVTKSGSNITGTIVQLVVVRVDAGYQGNPGHAGTGTIVAFVQ